MYQIQHARSMPPFESIQPSLLSYNARPNPLEPEPAAQQGSAFHSSSNEGLRRVLHKNAVQIVPQNKPAVDHAVKRRKLDDSQTFDLPKLPVRATQTRHPRLPPTLSGLHQPPPNAGLLPSISVEQPGQQVKAAAQTTQACPALVNDKTGDDSQAVATTRASRARPGRNKWTDEDTKCLLQGVARFGIGNWTKILRCPNYDFGKRTALDLKDRFRVCCPDQYGSSTIDSKASSAVATSVIKARSGNSTAVDLTELGIKAPFTRIKRRQRHGYTEAEDEHLLQGYNLYGKAWSRIQQDATLELGHRTRTDLRDRMRTRYPKYLNLTPMRQDDVPVEEIQQENSRQHVSNDTQSAAAASNISQEQKQTPTKPMVTSTIPDQAAANWMTTDPYLTLAYDDEEFDAQAITLDRGILDWPGNADSHASRPFVDDFSRQSNYTSSLPPLASITAPGSHQLVDTASMYELPALLQFFGPSLDAEDRSGPHTSLSLDDLLGSSM